MSAIASFYFLPAAKRAALECAARTGAVYPRRFLFVSFGRFQPSPFPAFLANHAREDNGFAWSGWAFYWLDLFLEEMDRPSLTTCCIEPLSGEVSRAQGGGVWFFDGDGARKLASSLDGLSVPPDVLARVLPHAPSEQDFSCEAVRGAAETLREPFAQLGDDTLGLLDIGA